MSNWFKYNGRRKIIREDRRYLKARARRLLKSYLLAEWLEKNQYYEVVAGAADACRPEMSDPSRDDAQIAEARRFPPQFGFPTMGFLAFGSRVFIFLQVPNLCE